MDNLVRENYEKSADEQVKLELMTARIPVVNVGGIVDAEVKTSYIGVLNGFTFRRYGRYWKVCGYMPMKHAREIYEAYPGLGIKAGEACCGNGNPEEAWVCEGPGLANELMEIRKKCSSVKEFMETIAERVNEDPDAFKYVKVYHVNSLLGLCKLAYAIREEDIHSNIIEEQGV